jgi:hypothetical protein
VIQRLSIMLSETQKHRRRVRSTCRLLGLGLNGIFIE